MIGRALTQAEFLEPPLKIAVTGARGQLVRSLLEAAVGRQVEAAALARPEFDLLDRNSVDRAIDAAAPDILVNAAAYTAVDAAETDEAAAFAVNATGAEHVAMACAARGIPIIHISTDYVFDGGKAAPYLETDPTGPTGAYGRSKLEGEQRVAYACSAHIVLRTAWVHSPFGRNFVKTMLRLADERSTVSVVDDQVGSPTYAPHLAEAILGVARQINGASDVRWGIYHAAGSGSASWCELAKEVFVASAALGGPTAIVSGIPSSAYPVAAQRPANSRLDSAKLASVFGLQLPAWRTGISEGVRRLVLEKRQEIPLSS